MPDDDEEDFLGGYESDTFPPSLEIFLYLPIITPIPDESINLIFLKSNTIFFIDLESNIISISSLTSLVL